MVDLKKTAMNNNMHPEVRITLKSILNMSNLAIASPHKDDLLVYMRKIQTTAASLLRTLDKLEGIGDSGQVPVELESVEFDLEQVLEDLRDQLVEQIELKGLEFVFQIAPAVPTRLYGDALRLGQVLLNLANNAIKFTENGEVVVDVAIVEKGDNYVVLEFQVKDTGIGLTEEQQTALFEEAQDSFTVTQHHIIGVGIVKQLVEKMGGAVFVSSKVGKGSIFGFTAKFKVAKDSMHGPSDILSGRRAMVVDDNASVRKTMALMLETLGLEVTTASSGKEAIERLLKADTDNVPLELVFMDWMMPGMDGLEASSRILNHSELTWKPHIAMITAYGRNDLRLAAKKVGVDCFLTKPVSASTLQYTILTLLSLL